MNIAYILPSLQNSGPILVIELLARKMVEHGHSCHVFYFDEKPSINFSCPTVRIDRKSPPDFTIYDVVHSSGVRPDMYLSKYREYSGKTKYISTIHNFFLEDFTSQYNWLTAHLYGRYWMHKLSRLDRIVTLSEAGIVYYRRWFNDDKLTFAYNSRALDISGNLDPEEINKLKTFKGEHTLIGINAALSPVKGVDMVIRALSTLPNHKLFIVGDGKIRRQLEALADEQGVRSRCYFAGYRSDAYKYLPYYDINALPSRSEGFGLALLEGAIYRKPCVTSDLPVFRECFGDGAVAMFELAKPQTIVQAIEYATTHPDLGDKIYDKYTQCYSPEAMYERYIQIYHGTL